MSPQFDAGKLAEDIKTLVRDAEALLRASAEGAEELSEEARDRAQQSLHALRSQLADIERDLKGRAEVLDGYVRDNPWAAVAVVGGIALLAGLLLGGRR
ncbi:MAG TPA: DUF883 family protein [Steroidobacteraceae bacterium]|jgi:ElaB/YqjD/DUF883 family membrane-anchored ribosome-binding protein|nr:DUF883 family protein [Steroidobacteraceae bacterium]